MDQLQKSLAKVVVRSFYRKRRGQEVATAHGFQNLDAVVDAESDVIIAAADHTDRTTPNAHG